MRLKLITSSAFFIFNNKLRKTERRNDKAQNTKQIYDKNNRFIVKFFDINILHSTHFAKHNNGIYAHKKHLSETIALQ